MTAPAHRPVGALSDDRLWRWDGTTWQRNEQAVAGDGPSAAGDDAESEFSQDGEWLWDGANWRRVTA